MLSHKKHQRSVKKRMGARARATNHGYPRGWSRRRYDSLMNVVRQLGRRSAGGWKKRFGSRLNGTEVLMNSNGLSLRKLATALE